MKYETFPKVDQTLKQVVKTGNGTQQSQEVASSLDPSELASSWISLKVLGTTIPIITEYNLQSVFLWIYWEVTPLKVLTPTETHTILSVNTEYYVCDTFRKVEPFATEKHCRFVDRDHIYEDIPRTRMISMLSLLCM